MKPTLVFQPLLFMVGCVALLLVSVGCPNPLQPVPAAAAAVGSITGTVVTDGETDNSGIAVSAELTEGLLCERLSSREIGERLHISERTVEKHTEHAYAKMGVHRRRDLQGILIP